MLTRPAAAEGDVPTPPGLSSITVLGGCGHVGLPLGIAFAERGHHVTLVDTSTERVASVQAGRLPFIERGADAILVEVLAAGRLSATSDTASIGESDVVVVCLGTPLDDHLDPEVFAFDRAMDGLLDRMRDGQMLVLRSTVFPGLTERLGRWIERRGLRIDLAYCPERIAQGFSLVELRKLPQLVSGTTPAAASRASLLFASLGAKVIRLAPLEAELGKLFANAYRYANFAIANQFYTMAERFGVSYPTIHAALTDDYPRLAGLAHAGFVGGPCLLKDTMQLAAFNQSNFILGQAAMMVNEGLPSFIVERIRATRDLRTSVVGIVGMAFKGNSDDFRDSPAYKLQKILTISCEQVLCTDPYIRDPAFLPLEEVVARSDVLVLGACHDEYRALRTHKPLIDVFNFIEEDRA